MSNNKSLDSLKIALVHEALTIPGGAEKVLWELHQLFPDAPIYTPFYCQEKFPQFKNAKIINSTWNRYNFISKRHQLTNPFLPYLFEQFDLSSYDLVISSSTASAKGVLTRPETIHVCYCHTPMRWAWLPYLDPRASSSFIRRLSAHYLRIWDIISSNRVDHWFANSHTTQERIKKFYRRTAQVIYPPVAIESIKPEEDNDGYYLTVGRLVAQKRVDIIIEAAKDLGLPLKIIGIGPLEQKLKNQAGQSSSVEFLGFVSDTELQQLYKRCKAFIFASEEDFGIVPIEAMAYGKPVIAFGRGGASETIKHGQTGLLFDEQTAESLKHALTDFPNITFDTQKIAHHAQQFNSTQFRQAITDQLISIIQTDS